jgi:hypothetical protein
MSDQNESDEKSEVESRREFGQSTRRESLPIFST